MTAMLDLKRRAKKNPGHCAICSRPLRIPARGGRPGFICGERIRKGCRKAYQTAYRESLRPKAHTRKLTKGPRTPAP